MPVKKNQAVEIPIDNEKLRGSLTPPSQLIPEKDKDASWYFNNLNYILTFYNQLVGDVLFPNASESALDLNRGSGNPIGLSSFSNRYPVQFMIRMMQYYLGNQPNLSYNWLTQDVQQNNLQANWIKGNDVSEFVNYFRGLILGRVSNAKFTAHALSKDAVSKKQELLDDLMMKFDMKSFFDQMAALGVQYTPAKTPEFETPEEVQKWVDTNSKEYTAILAGDIANGIWFSNHWIQKVLQAFMHTTIAGTCAMEHYVENGRNLQKIIMPYQLIYDNRIDDDYGRYDQFIGKVDNMSPNEIFSRYNELTEDMRFDIEKMSQDNTLGAPFNNGKNINWWVYNSNNQRNTVSVVTVYWRGRRYLNKKKVQNKYKTNKIVNVDDKEMDPTYSFDDIYKCTLIGNKYLVNWGLTDNVVEELGNKSKPLFPIIRFMPNTFMGESISEVARVYKIQDELDMYDFKIREMIGRSKGKVYIVNASKFDESTTPKEFFDDLNSMGVSLQRGTSGEVGDPTNSARTVETIDWTLDPNIGQLAQLYRDRKERMGKILSTSQIALGQQTKYVGLGTQQSTIAQNNLGVSYLVDGFMDWIVMNMRYAVNQAKNLYTIGDTMDLSFLIGDRGMAFLKITKEMRLEDFFVELNINDSIDEATKARTLSYAQAWSQNPEWGISPLEILKLDRATSSTKSLEELEFTLNKAEKKKEKTQQEQNQIAQQQMALKAQAEQEALNMKAALEQLKQDNENWRTQYTQDMKALISQISLLSQPLPTPPPSSPLQAGMGQPVNQQQMNVPPGQEGML